MCIGDDIRLGRIACNNRLERYFRNTVLDSFAILLGIQIREGSIPVIVRPFHKMVFLAMNPQTISSHLNLFNYAFSINPYIILHDTDGRPLILFPHKLLILTTLHLLVV